MSLENYSRVVLLTDRHQDQGVKIGAIGYIIEIYDDGNYEVEFSDSDGFTIAQLVLRSDEVELAEE
jgi:cell shape-determining protein MreC